MEKQENKPAVQNPVEKLEVSYEVLGQEVKLTESMVTNILTKGDGNLTRTEVIQFMSLCKFNQLNPFIGEVYPVKFKNNRGGEDAAQMIVSKEALMKRAEGCESYKGFRAGLIVKHGTEVQYPEGEFMLGGDVLLGGWAEVYRSDRDFPIKAFVNLKDYDKGRSTWNAIKCTMIRKVALVHAMREAFPTQLGALYTPEERIQPEDVSFEEVNDQKIAANANSQELPEEQPEEGALKPEPTPENAPKNPMPSVFD